MSAQIIETLYETHLSELTATVKAELISLLSKDLKKELKHSTKKIREVKLDEEGNVVKKPLNEGMVQWREFYTYLQKKLVELTGNDKVSLKQCICVGSILKKEGHYPEENLSDEVALAEYNSWITLTPEEQKEKRDQVKTSSTANSEVDVSDVEAKPKKQTKTKAKKEEVFPEEKAKAQPKEVVEEVTEVIAEVVAEKKKTVAKKSKKENKE